MLVYMLTFPSAPLLGNILPHLQTLLSFIAYTLPKPILASLLYRLIILHLASRVLPSIGSDSWDADVGVDGGWEGRPVCSKIYQNNKPTNVLINRHPN